MWYWDKPLLRASKAVLQSSLSDANVNKDSWLTEQLIFHQFLLDSTERLHWQQTTLSMNLGNTLPCTYQNLARNTLAGQGLFPIGSTANILGHLFSCMHVGCVPLLCLKARELTVAISSTNTVRDFTAFRRGLDT